MKLFFKVLFIFALLPWQLEGQRRGKWGHHAEPGSPWLGIRLTWMEKATAAQLKGVPEGFGLLIEHVESSSPAQVAGLQRLDVLWKYDDQLVASKSQLFALIKRTGIGNEAALTLSRAGEDIIMPVVVGLRPENPKELVQGASEVFMPPLPGAVVRQLDLGKRSGYIEEGGVTVSLTRKVKGFFYSVSEGEKVVEEGTLDGDDATSWPTTIDDKTRRKLEVLLQSLVNAENRDSNSPRRPRVRRVPALSPKSEK